MKITPVILSGGSGTRLWPLSRVDQPKQFLPMNAEQTLLQQTVQRLAVLGSTSMNFSDCMLVCNEAHRFIAAEQLREIGVSSCNILLEPLARNTAPAIALAAMEVLAHDPDGVLLVLAADHFIQDTNKLANAIEGALDLVMNDYLITFGVVPTYAETGYGYIKRGEAKGEGFLVQEFVEKPNKKAAECYVNSGDFLWNSGMFMFKASAILSEIRLYANEVASSCAEAMKHKSIDSDFIRIDSAAFSRSPSVSIDYAVMEKTANAVVVPLATAWSDLGTWSSIWRNNKKDQNDNVSRGDVVLTETSNSLVYASTRLVTTLGISDTVVVETKDAVLIANKDKMQDLDTIITQLKVDNRPEYQLHPDRCRPWGHYTQLDVGQHYQVKKLSIKPGASISLQLHHHRAEHWIVVAGTAQVTMGPNTRDATPPLASQLKHFTLCANQSTYVPEHTVHAIKNIGDSDLVLIEVQTGDYLGEDDIVRFS